MIKLSPELTAAGQPGIRPVESMVPLYVALLGPDAKRYSGKILDAQTGLPLDS